MSAVTVTNAGLNLMRDGMSGVSTNWKIKYVALGSSATAPAVTDTKLGNETFRKAVTSYLNGANPGEIFINLYLAPNDAVGFDIEEIGFFCGTTATAAPNSGIMLARGLYTLNPKTNLASLQFQLDLTI